MRSVFLAVCILSFRSLVGQSVDFTLGHAAYQLLELEEVRSQASFSTTFKPVSRVELAGLMAAKSRSYLSLELRPYQADSTVSEKSILKKLYRNPADFYHYEDANVDVHFNPVLHLSYNGTSDALGSAYVYSRGAEIRGHIDGKVAFYTMVTENQVRYPEYVNAIRDSTLVIPYEGFWKQYNETGVDFLRAQGYVDFGLSKSISAQLGFGKHFVGNGVRSLILSDYANNYPYLRINTQTKIFDYTNVFAELIANVNGDAGGTFGFQGFTKKYMAMHHLNVKLKPNLHIGLFESVMYGDSTSGLKAAYFNPVIFYRAVEQQNGSEDNAMVGMDFKWNIKQRISLYGQLVIDELIVGELFAGNGWWGNKQGFQLGAKYVDAFGLENLMLQGEVNRVRPYMYAHEDGFTNYSHYNLALAHPLGANFTEYLGRINYRINDKWNIEGMLMSARYGNDLGDVNYGRDILKDYTVRVPNGSGGNRDFGNSHLQGNETTMLMGFCRASYMWKHNLFLDSEVTYRRESDTAGRIENSATIYGLALRWNVPGRNFLF